MLEVVSRILFYVIAIELVVGGGGRLTAVGPVSLRMILFVVAIAVTAIHFIRGKRIPADYAKGMIVFATMLAIGALLGIMNGAGTRNVWEDVKPLLYFLLLPFLYFTANERVIDIFKYSSVAMAIIFIAILLLIHTGIVPFLAFYHLVLPTEEFFFRGELTFFYKGFLYLCVGFIFLIEGKSKNWQTLIVLLAIILTVTRGFWVSLLLTYGVYYLMFNRQLIVRGVALIILAVLLVFFSGTAIATVSKMFDREQEVQTGAATPRTYLLGDRTHSDNERMRQLKQVAEQLTAISAAIGHGFGKGIPIRPIHMEISYLEIFHKQGILGLSCWLLIFLTGFKKFLEVKQDSYTVPFFLAFVFVFVQSVSNQFINNPIGLFLVMICIICLDRARENKFIRPVN